ncbi:MAG TPA: peptide-methionine (S)-S-oxide reductase MsrA [Solirubrobacteraceae bacterium]|jgi:peptide-methionine (S)-S-oxide reductase
MSLFKRPSPSVIDPSHALPGREQPLPLAERHVVLGTPLQLDGPSVPAGVHTAIFGMGCFWGAERIFWQSPGVYTTAVGYAGGTTPNPTYEEVCSGRTGHAEVVLVAFDTTHTSFEEMLKLFWEGHDPTQGMRQGNDTGSQYRSLIACADEQQLRAAETSRDTYQRMLSASGHGLITTEILPPDPTRPFYYAEDYHQQYLEKNPGGYCGLGGTGVSCPVGLTAA